MKTITQQKIAYLIHALAASVFLIVAVCLFLILNAAGSVANDLHEKDTNLLVENELTRQIEIVARDQSMISNWNDTLDAFGKKIKMRFVRNEIAAWLWEDFEIKSSVVIGPDGEPRISVFKEKIIKPEAGKPLVAASADLVELTKKRYFEKRKARGTKFTFSASPLDESSPLYAAGYRIIEGNLSIVVAQAIVPSTSKLLPAGNPHILLVYRTVTDKMLQAISRRLNLQDFQLSMTQKPEVDSIYQMQFKGTNLQASWVEDKPSAGIWKNSIALVIAVLSTVAAALVFLSMRSAQLLSKLYEKQEENRFMAMHDALTGLPNRAQFDQLVTNISKENQFSGHAILCIDLDRFKAVNDTYGHHAGDAVLITTAQRISKVLGEKGIVARMGGDEFTAILQDISDKDGVVEICNDIVMRVAEEIPFEGGSAFIGASVGVAYWPDLSKTAQLVLRDADEALYKAKENGRGCVHVAHQGDTDTQSNTSDAKSLAAA